jgi:hypothetical protein
MKTMHFASSHFTTTQVVASSNLKRSEILATTITGRHRAGSRAKRAT